MTHKLSLCILVCSNGGPTYIVREIIAKDSLNIENLMQTFENLLSKLLNKILRYCTQIVLGYV